MNIQIIKYSVIAATIAVLSFSLYKIYETNILVEMRTQELNKLTEKLLENTKQRNLILDELKIIEQHLQIDGKSLKD